MDVPVLKVIGGSSIRDICQDVLGKLSLTFETSECHDNPVSVTMVDQGKTPFVGVVKVIDSDAETVPRGKE